MRKNDAFILLILFICLAAIMLSGCVPARRYPEPDPISFKALGYCEISCPESGPGICYKWVGGQCRPVAIK